MILNIGSTLMDGDKRKYILDDIIGQGGFGYVYKAHREDDGNIFAIKTTLPSFFDKSSENAFKNEIQAALEIRGDNVIRYEFAHTGEKYPELPPYIIMEYANNGTLQDIINQRKRTKSFYSTEELFDIFRQLANGMNDINSLLVHRDIKPENILLCDSVLKITDFGLSKVAVEKTRTITFKGGRTPLYMSPEAWDFSKNTIQMDIYSMGIIFYELAALEYPYSPMPRTQEDAKNLHLYSPIQNIGNFNSRLDPKIISIINRMLEKVPKKRFKSWTEIIQSLEQPSSLDSSLDNIVAMAVATKNSLDLQRQKQESELRKQAKEKEDFCKLVHSQFDNTIISILKDYVDKVNVGYAGVHKAQLKYNNDIIPRQNHISCRLIALEGRYVDIKIEIVFKENYVRKVPIDNFWDVEQRYREEEYIPQYRGKNIMAFGKINNSEGLGCNLLLVDSGEIYGDWLIMNNKNNLSYMTQNKERREPFAFDLEELPDEINKVQGTHLYTSDFEEYSDEKFISCINRLATM